MPFPPGWDAAAGRGLPLPSGVRSMRFFASGNTTANFADAAWNFAVSPAGGADRSMMIPTAPRVDPGDEVASGAPVTPVVSSPIGGQTTAPALQYTPVTTQAAYAIRIHNDGAASIEFSFDGITVHGVVRTGEKLEYRRRFETGIALRGAGGVAVAFRVEAW